MAGDNTITTEGPTRRDIVRLSGTTAGAGLLAGCSGLASPSAEDGPADEPTSTATSDGPYTVEMAPVGEVEFDSPPESVAHFFPGYADMAVALGHGDSINAIGWKRRYRTFHYDELDGVSVDTDSMAQLQTRSGFDLEVMYELDSALHMIDPNWLTNNSHFGLDESDIDQLSSAVAPFLGNTVFRRTDGWHDYRYYTLYEAFEKVAKVHREQATFEAFREFHDALVADVQAKLPPAEERPNGLLCWAGVDNPIRFYPYRITDQGTNKKQFHDLGIHDALAGSGIDGLSESHRGMIDYETMVEVDPDAILLRGHEEKTRAEFEETVLAYMKHHDTAANLRAVRNGQVFRGGPIYSGPVHHLFLLERFATAYFPDRFSGELVDRDELASIITG
jgi:iron complex transport system substrate-binding protein